MPADLDLHSFHQIPAESTRLKDISIFSVQSTEGFINVISLLPFSEEFSLKIVQLNLEDDDRYQCQVMATANSSSLVSQFAYVNVLGKFLVGPI